MEGKENAGIEYRMFVAWKEHLKKTWSKGIPGKVQASFEIVTIPPFLLWIFLFSLWCKHLKTLSGKGGNGKVLAGLEIVFPVILLLVLVSLNIQKIPEGESSSVPNKMAVSTPVPTSLPNSTPVQSIPKPVETPEVANALDQTSFIKMAMAPENAASERDDMLRYLKMLENMKKDLDSRYAHCRKHGYQASNAQEWGSWFHQWNRSLKDFEKGLEAVFYVEKSGVYQGKWKEAFEKFRMSCTDLFLLWSSYDSELDRRNGDVSHFKTQFEKRLKSAKKGLN